MTKFQLNLRSVFIIVLVVGAVGLVTYFILLSQADPDKDPYVSPQSDELFGWKYPVAMFPEVGPVTEQIAYSDLRDPGGIPQGLPVRLKIPVIGVDSAIEDALITPDGRMDVPYGSVNVAWFALGPHPGREGSAVIGGHFGISNGVKFVFYDLDKLKIGDKIYIVDDKGDTLAFQVRDIKLFNRNDDATTVFTSDDGLAHLNLITCEGIWNRVNDTYPQRRVVFTDAISAIGAAEASNVFYRSLIIGTKGEDVARLQTILIEKGFLIMPRGVSKGYFGTLTRTAVAKYQTSVGLPSTGIFDSATRVKLIPPTVVAREPSLPSTALSSKPESFLKTVINHLKSLYETPMDGLVTSILLVVIIFTAFNVVKNRFKKLD